MATGNGENDNNYKIPNKSSAFVQAPNKIIKDGASPKVTKGGDLRSKGSK